MARSRQLTNEEHERLAAWADELARERRGRLPICPFCLLTEWFDGADRETARERAPVMQFRHGNIHREPIAWGQNRKCPECYLIAGFGIPMHADEFDRTKELMNGAKNYNGKPAEDLDEREVQENLAALGYLEM